MDAHLSPTVICITVAVVLLIVAPYIGGPFLIKSSQSIDRRPIQQRFDPATLPASVAPFFYSAVQALAACGFTVIDYVTKPNEVPNVTPCIVYLVNRANGDMASIACFFSSLNGETRIQNLSIFLTTIHANGEIVSSCSMPPTSAGSCYKTRPYVHGVRFFDLVEPAELYKRHRFLLQKYSVNSQPVIPELGREMEAHDRANADVNEYQVKRGVLKIDPARDVYIPTWYGAFYMTWALLWPCKQIRLAQSQAKSRRELEAYRRSQ